MEAGYNCCNIALQTFLKLYRVGSGGKIFHSKFSANKKMKIFWFLLLLLSFQKQLLPASILHSVSFPRAGSPFKSDINSILSQLYQVSKIYTNFEIVKDWIKSRIPLDWLLPSPTSLYMYAGHKRRSRPCISQFQSLKIRRSTNFVYFRNSDQARNWWNIRSGGLFFAFHACIPPSQ